MVENDETEFFLVEFEYCRRVVDLTSAADVVTTSDIGDGTRFSGSNYLEIESDHLVLLC